MASIETNVAFVKELLLSPNISNHQVLQILDLLKNDMAEMFKSSIDKKETTETYRNSKTKKFLNQKIHHYPKETVKLLNKFSEDTALKYATHIWDFDPDSGKENVNRSTFIQSLEKELKDFRFQDILKKNGLTNFYWTIHNFLLEENKGWNTNVWGEHKLKFGWNNKCLIEYFQNNPSEQPANFEIPSQFLPKEYTKEFWKKVDSNKREKEHQTIEIQIEDIVGDKKINGRFLKYFEDYINLFKTEIEFRGNSLHYLIEEEFLSKLNNLEYNIEIKGLKGALIYTCTLQIKQAIQIIVSNLKARPEKLKNIQITGNQISDLGCFEVSITDVGSFSEVPLTYNKLRLVTGQLKNIRNNLRGLCDFSIISSFKDENDELGFYELDYLSIERPEFKKDDEQFIAKKIDNAHGFTYKLKFYV
jgi:hypothetical protein